MRVAVLGAGRMGSGMIKNLVAAGYPVSVYDPAPAASRRAAGLGAEPADSPADAARGAQIVICSLPSPQIVREAVLGPGGAAETLVAGAVVADASTADPLTARELHRALGERGIAFLDTPVSGGPGGAAAGTLAIMAGGDPEAFELARGVLQVIGKNIYYLGPSGSGQTVKLCHNMVVAATTCALSEAFLVAERGGISRAMLADVMAKSVGRSGTLEIFGPNLVHSSYDKVIFGLSLMHKDVRLYLETAQALQIPSLMGSQAFQFFTAALGQGKGDLDQSAVTTVWEAVLA